MEKLPGGSLLKLLCDSEVTVHETIPRYCEKNAYEFETVRLEDEGYWEIFILKK
jgi:tRNA 2-thiouridine synthesizing protein A